MSFLGLGGLVSSVFGYTTVSIFCQNSQYSVNTKVIIFTTVIGVNMVGQTNGLSVWITVLLEYC